MTRRDSIIPWSVFCLAPLALCLVALVYSESEGIRQYKACMTESRDLLPLEQRGVCCVLKDRSRNYTHSDRLLVPLVDEIRILWNRVHSGSGILVCLFLTPTLLYMFALLTNDRFFWRAATLAVFAAYVSIVLSIAYALPQI